jgi:glutamyl-Q tRNA(Asp) synthetase
MRGLLGIKETYGASRPHGTTPGAARWAQGAAPPPPGLALQWWLQQLKSETTRRALLELQRQLESLVSAYRGRFAPSPTGPLHAGSLVAALASWLDARAHRGAMAGAHRGRRPPRCPPGMDRLILGQLARCGLLADDEPVWQSQRESRLCGRWSAPGGRRPGLPLRLHARIEKLVAAQGHPTSARRAASTPAPAARAGGPAPRPRLAPAPADDDACVRWLVRPPPGPAAARRGAQVGDFVLRRADGLWAYQLAVVVDDAAQGITDVVRGEDLADNTPRQILLQRALGLPSRATCTCRWCWRRRPEAQQAERRAGLRAATSHDPLPRCSGRDGAGPAGYAATTAATGWPAAVDGLGPGCTMA